ncbi:MAG: hypothetical protein ACR2NR_03130 [Solirubrobacteraceae bacterium]
MGSDLWQPVAHDLVWTHTDGFFLVDQRQYLSWISDLFGLRATLPD